MQKYLSGGESRLGGDEGRRGRCKKYLNVLSKAVIGVDWPVYAP